MREGFCVMVLYKSEKMWGCLGKVDIGSGQELRLEDLNSCTMLFRLGNDGSSENA